jgi:hypothetical protein
MHGTNIKLQKKKKKNFEKVDTDLNVEHMQLFQRNTRYSP